MCSHDGDSEPLGCRGSGSINRQRRERAKALRGGRSATCCQSRRREMTVPKPTKLEVRQVGGVKSTPKGNA